MTHLKTDICVIGGGAGGLSVAAGAAQMGAKVILLEGHKMGGDCLNYGCVPSKAMLSAATAAHHHTQGQVFGVTPKPATIDFAKVQDHVQSVIKAIEPHDSVERFTGLGVQVIEEFGQFISPSQVQAGPHIITARRFVIATGSRPFVPPITGLDGVPYDTNETIFTHQTCPKELLIIGAGPIGLEMAQAHHRLGSKVTVVEAQTAMGKDDPELAALVLEKLRAEGITILENSSVEKISGKAGAIVLSTQTGQKIKGSHLLVAVGRQANIERLNLAAAGIETHQRGIKIDDRLRSTNKRVFAIGDVAGGLQFTHVAGYHAGVVVRAALFGLPAKARDDHIPWVTYTDPELAQVGLTETQARAKYGSKLFVATADFADNDRARASAKTTGRVKVMVVKGRPVGATIVGPQAGELIQIWALALANGLKMSAIAGMVAPYPTLGEVNKRAASAYFTPKLFESARVKAVVRFIQRL